MSKTDETMQIEKALYVYSGANHLGVYGGFEVTLGAGYGNERVDFMTMDSEDNFRCYEIKVTKSDFKSKAKLSFMGNFNYLVLPAALLEEIKELDEFHQLMFHGVGVLVYQDGELFLERKAKKKPLQLSQKVDLMHAMVRSLSRYCKYELE